MINLTLENHSWVSINRMNVEDLEKVLRNIEISRYATGGVESTNKGIREIIGDGSFWDKFVFHTGKWRLGAISEGCCEDKELQFSYMFTDGIDLSKI